MADNPQQTIRELRELVVEYTKQETIEPLKGLGRYIRFGLSGALAMGFGFMFVAIGLLRLLQEETIFGKPAYYYWSWVPYLIVVVVMGALAGIFWVLRSRRAGRNP